MTNKPAPNTEISDQEPSQLKLTVGHANEEVGLILREQRLKRRIPLERAGAALKLSPMILEDLEKGALDRHPHLYRRGYVRNYARFLGLDAAPLMALLEGEEAPPLRPVLPAQRRAAKFDRFLKIATYAIVTTVIIPPIVWIYIQGGWHLLDRENGSERASVVRADRTERPLLSAAEQTSRSADDAQVADSGINDPVTVPVTASALPLSSIRPVRDLVEPTVDGGIESALADESVGSAAPDPRSNLVIELLDDSWLEVYGADGQRLEYDLLRAGQRRTYSAEAPFRLLLGRANAITLTLDGQAIEFEGQDRGDVASFELLADGVVRRQ